MGAHRNQVVTWLFVVILGYHEAIADIQFPSDDITFLPKSGSVYYSNGKATLQYEIASRIKEYIRLQNNSEFYLALNYKEKEKRWRKVVEFEVQRHWAGNQKLEYKTLHTLEAKSSESNNSSEEFMMYLNGIGHVELQIDIVEVSDYNKTSIAARTSYKLTVIRKQRLVDRAFNACIAILAILNAFALGCISDIKLVKHQSKKLVKMVITFLTQYCILPLVAFGLSKLLDVQNEIALGLLFTACVPGGGLGHLIVAITGDAELELSVALNMFHLLIPLGIVPLYVYTLGQLLPNDAGYVVKETYFLGLWNIALLIPYACGMLVRKHRETISDAFMNWIMKPLLLLAFILFITLGLYINMYMFSVLDKMALITGGVIPVIGFTVGGGVTLLARQGKPAAKTIAIETTITNCIAVIVAVRFTLPQPEADLASAGVMWVFFLTPAPVLLMYITHKIKRTIMSYFDKKEIKKEQQETILQSFAAITHNAMQMGGVHTAGDGTTQDNLDVTFSANTNENNEMGDRAMLLRKLSRHSDPSHVIANNIACMELSPHADPTIIDSRDTVFLDTQSENAGSS